MKISFVVPNRNNLKYFKWSYDSIRKNQGDHEVWICSAVDACTDGTLEYYEELAKNDPYFKYIVNDGPDRLGHTVLYDKIVWELVETDLAMIWHCDMYLCPNALDEIEKLMYEDIIHPTLGPVDVRKNKRRIISLTRIEPPLHPAGKEKLVMDFGTEPENFDERGLLAQLHVFRHIDQYNQKTANGNISIPVKGTTNGVFAPWAFWVDEFKQIGGHDWMFRPQSKEDCCHKDTLLFVEIGGIREYVTVQELWNRFSEFKTRRDDGNFYIDFSKCRISVRCMTPYPNGEVGMAKVNKILLKTVPTDKLVKVRTIFGEVVVTTDHSLIDSECRGVKIQELETVSMWEPNKFVGDLIRPVYLRKFIDFNKIDDIENLSNIKLKIISDIDEYGNNQDLINICEFLGFFVAEGSASVTKNTGYISICSNNIELLNDMKQKSISLFGYDLWNSLLTSEKLGHKDVYHYRKTDKNLANYMRNLVGINSKYKQVPNFIYNLPKAYQESFLYGYLVGDGYLGTTMTRQKKEISFSVDKRLFFKKNIFDFVTWKSTSKSEKLTAGINILIHQCFPSIKTRIQFASKKGKIGVYNLSTCNYHTSKKLEICPYKSNVDSECVFDLEVRGTNSFVGGVGLIGLHNSDIWNRQHLTNIHFLQTRQGFVYHLTCRGSRRNVTDGAVDIYTNNPEWEKQNLRSSRNFIRKWGHFVQHDEYLHPIVPHKYDIACVIENCSYNLMANLEPWFSEMQVDLPVNVVEDYIQAEQPNTSFDLRDRLNHLPLNIEDIHDVIVYIDGHRFDGDDFYYIQQLSNILTENQPEGGCEFQIGHLRLKVNRLKTYERGLIVCDNSKIEL